jgi:hypothetical protein
VPLPAGPGPVSALRIIVRFVFLFPTPFVAIATIAYAIGIYFDKQIK